MTKSLAAATIRLWPFLLFTVPSPAQGRGGMPPLPVMTALDADKNGELSTTEIANASTALATLDKDGNGKLTSEELMPAGGTGRGGRGGPGGPGGAGMMRMIPLIAALDVDGDGEVSADECKNAPASLKALDKDGTGKLTSAQLVPSFGGPGGGMGGFGGPVGPRKDPTELDPADGTATIPDRATFQRLSYQGSEVMIDTQLTGLQFVKFVVADAGTDKAKIYFMNTKKYRAHPMFTRIIGVQSGGRRGAVTPGAGRSMMGVLVFRPMLAAPSGQTGLYTFEFEPNDAYPFELISVVHDLLGKFAPAVLGNVAYHPLQAALAQTERDKAKYQAASLPVFFDDDLYKGIAYLPLHLAEGFGRLRRMALGERPDERDVVLYKTLPNEMPRVAGIITAVRQTPLSHVNLRAVQDDVPNAYIEGAAEKAAITALVGKYVHYRVAADGYELREATSQEVDAHFAKLRPKEPQVPVRDLAVQTIWPLDDIRFENGKSFGVKVSNLAALRAMDLPNGMVPDGHGIPFFFYDSFMQQNGFYEQAAAMQKTPGFATDAAVRAKALAAFQKQMAKGAMPEWMTAALGDLQRTFPAGTSIRCRSSTNTEDLPDFSGAGLYDSFTHKASEGELGKTIKKVFASLWNFRAFEEREFYRIDHFAAAMGVLVHPNYPAELANGVAVTDDIVYQTTEQVGRRYYVNAQIGSDLVTNPSAESIPEEILVHPSNARRDSVVRTSNRVADGKSLLDDDQLDELRRSLATIHREFRTLYGKKNNDQFAMEIEWKVTQEGKLAIKQARPWVY